MNAFQSVAPWMDIDIDGVPYGCYHHWDYSSKIIEERFTKGSVLKYLNQLDEIPLSEEHEVRIIEAARLNGIFPALREWDESVDGIDHLHKLLGLRALYNQYLAEGKINDMKIIVHYSYARAFLEECINLGVHKFYEFGYGDRRAIQLVDTACAGYFDSYFPAFLNAMSAHGYGHLHHLLLCCSYFMDYTISRSRWSKVDVNVLPYNIPYSDRRDNMNIGDLTYDVSNIFSDIMLHDQREYSSHFMKDLDSPESEIAYMYETGDPTRCVNLVKHGICKKKITNIIYIAWKELPHGPRKAGGIETDRERVNPVVKSIGDPVNLYTTITEFDRFILSSEDPFKSIAIPRERHIDRISFLEREFFERIVLPAAIADSAAMEKYIYLQFHEYYHEVYGEKPFTEYAIYSDNYDNNRYAYYCWNIDGRNMRKTFEAMKTLEYVKKDDITRPLVVTTRTHRMDTTNYHEVIRMFFPGHPILDVPKYVVFEDMKLINSSLPCIMLGDKICGAWMESLLPSFNGSQLRSTPAIVEVYLALCKYTRSLFHRTGIDNYYLYFITIGIACTVYLIDIDAPTDAIHVANFSVEIKGIIPVPGTLSGHICDQFVRDASLLFNAIIHDMKDRKRMNTISERLEGYITDLIPVVSAYSKPVYSSK